MNMRVLVVFVLVVIVPIAIGLYWIEANSKDFPVFELLLGFAESLLVAAAVYSILHAIASAQKRRWRRDIKREWEQDITEFQESLKGHIVAYSITCVKCGSSAHPILNSQDRYLCSKCGQDFAGVEHGLIDLDEFKRRNPDPSNMPYPGSYIGTY